MAAELDKKAFQERLQKCLDEIHMPAKHDERVKAFAKLFNMSTLKAANIIDGKMLPTKDEIVEIANEFEVDPNELMGISQTHPRSSR